MQAYTNRHIRYIGNRSQVNILPLPIAAHKFCTNLYQLVNRIGKRYLKNLAGTKQALIVFAKTEQIQLPIFLIPIAANALEAPGTISESVGTYRNDASLGGYIGRLIQLDHLERVVYGWLEEHPILVCPIASIPAR